MQNEYTCKDKESLRNLLGKLRSDVNDREKKELAATENILPHLYGNVMVYVSIGSELSTAFLIKKLMTRSDIMVYVPFTENNTITPVRLIAPTVKADKLGNVASDCFVSENMPITIDCCVTPLLGYNLRGHRIGYGKGCYDKFFSSGVGKCKKIGLAFDCQKCDFTADKHDVPLDAIVTESGIEVFS